MRTRPIARGPHEGRLADARLTVDQETGEAMGRLLQEALDRLELPCRPMRSPVPSGSPISVLYGRRPEREARSIPTASASITRCARSSRADTQADMDRPRHIRRGRSERQCVRIRLGGKGRPVGVAGHAGIEPVRISETQLDILPERLRLTARPVRAGAVQRCARVVIVPREGTPRLALILIAVLAASGHFPGQGGALSTMLRIMAAAGTPSPNRAMRRRAIGNTSYGRGRSRHWLSARVGRPLSGDAVR